MKKFRFAIAMAGVLPTGVHLWKKYYSRCTFSQSSEVFQMAGQTQAVVFIPTNLPNLCDYKLFHLSTYVDIKTVEDP